MCVCVCVCLSFFSVSVCLLGALNLRHLQRSSGLTCDPTCVRSGAAKSKRAARGRTADETKERKKKRKRAKTKRETAEKKEEQREGKGRGGEERSKRAEGNEMLSLLLTTIIS